jgi:subtilisin family serine protease
MSVPGNVYGDSFDQIAMHRGHLMHEAGFSGKGVDIAVMDAGFSMTDELAVFDHLRTMGLIMGSKDFVDGDENVFHGSSHGTFILSTIAGYMPDSLIGTAPHSNYWLFRTEDSDSESPLEEINWIAAAEFADSVGVDLMTTSLGYSEFDNENLNYTPDEMDGNTAWITRGSEIAASKGILVFSSAGNKGDKDWRIITAPADGRNVISVAAVGRDSSRAFFSSFGPGLNGRVKPDLAALGLQATYANFDGGISRGNGTSFSCPILAGLAACLVQANPRTSASKIRTAIQRSANLFYSPNDSLGYGIPDIWEAQLFLNENIDINDPQLQALVFPNPFQDRLTVVLRNVQEDVEIQLFDISGREIPGLNSILIHESDLVRTLELSSLPSGFYILRVISGSEELTRNILKSSF